MHRLLATCVNIRAVPRLRRANFILLRPAFTLSNTRLRVRSGTSAPRAMILALRGTRTGSSWLERNLENSLPRPPLRPSSFGCGQRRVAGMAATATKGTRRGGHCRGVRLPAHAGLRRTMSWAGLPCYEVFCNSSWETVMKVISKAALALAAAAVAGSAMAYGTGGYGNPAYGGPGYSGPAYGGFDSGYGAPGYGSQAIWWSEL